MRSLMFWVYQFIFLYIVDKVKKDTGSTRECYELKMSILSQHYCNSQMADGAAKLCSNSNFLARISLVFCSQCDQHDHGECARECTVFVFFLFCFNRTSPEGSAERRICHALAAQSLTYIPNFDNLLTDYSTRTKQTCS